MEMEHRATALCSPGGRQECLPYLPAATYATLGEMLQGEAGEAKKVKLRNKANKSLRINRYDFGSVQNPPKKATKSLQKAPNRGLFNGF